MMGCLLSNTLSIFRFFGSRKLYYQNYLFATKHTSRCQTRVILYVRANRLKGVEPKNIHKEVIVGKFWYKQHTELHRGISLKQVSFSCLSGSAPTQSIGKAFVWL